MHKYCAVTTSEHPVSQRNQAYRCSIKKIIKKEGGKGHLFKDDIVLDLDKIEKNLAKRGKRDKNMTMDVYFGISNNNRNKKIVLIDFKFNVKNPGNLGREELEGKVKSSKAIIGSEMSICNEYFFIFNSNVIQQSIHRFNRIFSGKPNNPYKAVTEKELHDKYW